MTASDFVFLLFGMHIDSGAGQTPLILLSIINMKIIYLKFDTEMLLLFSRV